MYNENHLSIKDYSWYVMKFIRFEKDGIEKIGVLKDPKITELTCSMDEAFKTSNINEFFDKDCVHSLNEVKILPPTSPTKVVCVGLNYADHAEELDMAIPEDPVIFIKPSTSVIGHLDPIIYPESSNQVDFEVELGIIISRYTHNVDQDDADLYIAGYTVLNDVTARDLQRKDVQWTRAKSFNTFCPIGPYTETELKYSNQKISLKLNGEVRQDSNTKNMIFSPQELIEFISEIMTLYPGDVIATGTPPGVGPMNVGDTVEAEIGGIGVLKNFVEK